MKRKYTDAQIRRAYEATKSDAEAGEMLGVTAGVFWFLRTRAGLPAKGRRGNPIGKHRAEKKRKYSDEAIREAYQATANDREAGKKLGVQAAYFCVLRKRTGLAAKGKRVSPFGNAQGLRAFREGYEKAGNDKELGKMLGITTGYACILRAKFGLPAKGRRWHRHMKITGMPFDLSTTLKAQGLRPFDEAQGLRDRVPVGVRLKEIANRYKEEQERLGRQMLAEVDEVLSQEVIEKAGT